MIKFIIILMSLLYLALDIIVPAFPGKTAIEIMMFILILLIYVIDILKDLKEDLNAKSEKSKGNSSK